MKISIITATYNSASTVRDTFESVLSQTHKDIDYWVIDGGSKDATIDIIKEYEKKFSGRMHWISEPDKGIYDAMNKGIARSTGEVVGILNSDDFFFDSVTLENINKAFEEHNTDCIFGNLIYVNAANTNIIERIWRGSEYREGIFKYGWVPAHPTFYVKRMCYERLGLYDLSYQVSADFELMLRYLAKHKVSSWYINKFLVRMRVGGESNSSIKNIILGNKNIIRAFNENGVDMSRFYTAHRLIPKFAQRIKMKCYRIMNKNAKL